MRTRWPGVVGEKSRDRPFRRDLDIREVFGEGALNGRIARADRAAARGDERGEDDRSKCYERGTLSRRDQLSVRRR